MCVFYFEGMILYSRVIVLQISLLTLTEEAHSIFYQLTFFVFYEKLFLCCFVFYGEDFLIWMGLVRICHII